MVMKLDSARICKMAIKTLEDCNVMVISEPTRMLSINEEDTLWI